MSEFRITINTDNAAFEDDAVMEVKRILKHLVVSPRMRESTSGSLVDVNGNKVGSFDFDSDEVQS